MIKGTESASTPNRQARGPMTVTDGSHSGHTQQTIKQASKRRTLTVTVCARAGSHARGHTLSMSAVR